MEVGGKLHAPAVFPQENKAGTHLIGGWVGPRAGLEGFGVVEALSVLKMF
jgi:hypothetical protein